MNTCVYVTFVEPGFHRWPDAPKERDYLAVPHRHLFHVKVYVGLNERESLDRSIEFHDLLDLSISEFRKINGQPCTTLSCEMMAVRLANAIGSVYRNRLITVDISEDGECGAVAQVNSVEVMG